MIATKIFCRGWTSNSTAQSHQIPKHFFATKPSAPPQKTSPQNSSSTKSDLAYWHEAVIKAELLQRQEGLRKEQEFKKKEKIENREFTRLQQRLAHIKEIKSQIKKSREQTVKLNRELLTMEMEMRGELPKMEDGLLDDLESKEEEPITTPPPTAPAESTAASSNTSSKTSVSRSRNY